VAQILINPAPNDPEIAWQNKQKPVQIAQPCGAFHFARNAATPQFYVLYLMMLMMVVGGLMATAQLSSVADALGIARRLYPGAHN